MSSTSIPHRPAAAWLALAGLLAACGGRGGGGPGGGGGGSGSDDLVPDVGKSEFRVTPVFGTPSDGTTSVDIELLLVNAAGKPIAGAEVELAISGCGNLLQELLPTDADGRTHGTLASTVGEKKTVEARTESGGPVTELGARTTEFLLIPDDTFFVRASGSDARSGRSPREAWGTLAHAFAQLQPGATLHVGAGVYAGPLAVELDSSAGHPLVISGDRTGVMTSDAGAVVIEAGGAPSALALRGARNVLVQGLTLRGAESGLSIEDSADVRVLACRLQENDLGLSIAGGDGLVVQDCRVSGNLQDGVRVTGARNARIENNLIYANGEDGLVLVAPAQGAVVRFNTFYRNGGNHLREQGLGGSGAIVANILTEGGDDPIVLAINTSYQTGANLIWANVQPGPSRQPPEGSIEGDPDFIDPFGPDGILGGAGAEDDDFRLRPDSDALDVGGQSARDVVLGSQESLATRTTRPDDGLDGSGADLPMANLGYHAALPPAPFASLPKDGARLVHAGPADVRLNAAPWASTSPTELAPGPGPLLEAQVLYLEQRHSPLETSEELVAAQVSTGTRGRILVRHWDGRRWSEPALSPFQDGIALADVVDKRFDLEYEDLSGRALLVLADGDGIPSFRVLERGAWTPLRDVSDVGAGAGKTRVVELVARKGSNEIALVTLDDQRDLVVRLWDGSEWSAPRLLEESTVYTPSWRPFDAAFESFTGDLLVTWGFSVFAEETRWATLERASGQWRTGQHPSTDAVGGDIKLASDPTSDRIAAVMGEGDLDNDVIVTVWTGADWVHTAELTLKGPVPNRLLELTWLGDSGIAAAIFRRDGHTGSFNVAFFLRPGWRIQPDVVLPGAGRAAQVRLVSPADRSQALGYLLDEQGRLFGLRFAAGVFSLLNEGVPLATGIDPLAPGRPFDVALSRTQAQQEQQSFHFK